MSHPFPDELARSSEFDNCVRPLFDAWYSQHHLAPAGGRTAIVNRTISSANNVIVLFREDRREMGTGDDAYMQLARDYDVYRKTIKPSDGCPAFLVSVWGMCTPS
jgi:hypothetical protein